MRVLQLPQLAVMARLQVRTDLGIRAAQQYTHRPSLRPCCWFFELLLQLWRGPLPAASGAL